MSPVAAAQAEVGVKTNKVPMATQVPQAPYPGRRAQPVEGDGYELTTKDDSPGRRPGTPVRHAPVTASAGSPTSRMQPDLIA
jgi:hypothetical protein